MENSLNEANTGPAEGAEGLVKSPHTATVVGLYEKQGCSIEQIAGSLHVPASYVELILKDHSPTFRADLAITKAAAQADEDIPDEMHTRIREEAFQIALDRQHNVATRAKMIQYLWDRKRPLLTTGQQSTNVTQINLAIVSAREILKKKLQLPEAADVK